MIPGSAVGNDDPHDGLPLRDAQRVGRLAQFVGNELQHLLGVAHHDRQHQQHQGERHREGALRRSRASSTQSAKMKSAATIDGTPARMSTMNVVTLREPPLAVLDQVDRCHHAQRNREDCGDQGLDDRAVDRVVDAAGDLFGQHAGQRAGPPRRRSDGREAPARRRCRAATPSGIIAIRNDAVNRALATLFFNLRLELIAWNVGALTGGVER